MLSGSCILKLGRNCPHMLHTLKAELKFKRQEKNACIVLMLDSWGPSHGTMEGHKRVTTGSHRGRQGEKAVYAVWNNSIRGRTDTTLRKASRETAVAPPCANYTSTLWGQNSQRAYRVVKHQISLEVAGFGCWLDWFCIFCQDFVDQLNSNLQE